MATGYKLTKEQEFLKNAGESNIIMDFVVANMNYEDQGESWNFGNFRNYLSDLIGDVFKSRRLFNEKKLTFCFTAPFTDLMLVNNSRNIFAKFFADSLETAIMKFQNDKYPKLKIFSVHYDDFDSVEEVVKIFSKYLEISYSELYDDYLVDGIRNKTALVNILAKNPKLLKAMAIYICIL